MKKFYTAIIFSLLSIGAFAQCTPDNTITQPGYYPPFMDTAKVNTNYEMVIHLRIPEDTVVTFFNQTLTADIDSIRLVNVLGFPQGFTYQCNVSNCLFEPKQNYCAKVTGTPSVNDVGTYPLRFAIVAYASAVVFGTRTALPPQADTLDQFELVVEGQGGTNSLTIVEDNKGFSLYPNPAQNQFTTLIKGKNGDKIEYSIMDIAGKVFAQQSFVLQGDTEFIATPCADWAKGIYFVQVTNSKGTFTQKLIVK
jgi:hypothetical protein